MDPTEFAKFEREEAFLQTMAILAAQCLRGRKLPYSAGARAQDAIDRYRVATQTAE